MVIGHAAAVTQLLALVTFLSSWVCTASTCTPLCDFGPLGDCHVSRAYTAQLAAWQGGPWSDIAKQIRACEATLKGDRDFVVPDAQRCESMAGCKFAEDGVCVVRKDWAMAKLSAPVERRGAGLGLERCGLLGEMLSRGVHCQANSDARSCAFHAVQRPEDGCGWSEALQRCDVSSAHVMRLASTEFRDQLARLNLERTQCARRAEAECHGICGWHPSGAGVNSTANASKNLRPTSGRCALRTLEALLALTGEDCPFSILLERHFSCGASEDREACIAAQNADGLPVCMWRAGTGTCHPHSMSLEFALLRPLRMDHPELLQRTRDAQRSCFAASSDQKRCVALCAPELPKPGPASSALSLHPSWIRCWLHLAVLYLWVSL